MLVECPEETVQGTNMHKEKPCRANNKGAESIGHFPCMLGKLFRNLAGGQQGSSAGRAHVTKPDDLSLTARTHTVEGES